MDLSGPSEGWSLVTGQLLAAAIVSLVGTVPVSLLLLALYRRRVARSMREATSRPPLAVAPPVLAGVPGPVVRLAPVLPARSGRLEAQARHAVRRAELLFALAGVAFGVTTLVVLFGLDDLEPLPVRTLSVALAFSWPAVPAVLAQRPAASALTKVLVWTAYVGLVLLLPVLAGGLPPGQALLLVVLTVGISGVWALATGSRFVRGAAWFVAPALTALTLVGLQLYVVWVYLDLGVPLDVAALAHLGGAAIVVVVLVGYTTCLVAAWRAKLVGDQTLLVVQWWFVATMGVVLDLTAAHGAAGLLGTLPLLAATAVVVLGTRLLPLERGRPRRLLLLRTFGSRARSTRLLRRLTQAWRWVGSVQLISAPDTAAETLGADDLGSLLRGVRQRVVTDPDVLARRLDEVDLQPDRDGRYRVTELLCSATMWQPTVQRLIDDADAVLVDLRQFHAGNAGVAHELGRLVDSVDLDRVVALVDGSTDLRALDDALAVAVQRSSPSSPVRTGGTTVLRTVQDGRAGPAQLVAALDGSGTRDADDVPSGGPGRWLHR